MGRGRQKAKDAKIARQLKYTTHGSDLQALERELVSGGTPLAAPDPEPVEDDDTDEYVDRWADVDDHAEGSR